MTDPVGPLLALRYELLERMLQPCGPPPPKEDDEVILSSNMGVIVTCVVVNPHNTILLFDTTIEMIPGC